MTAALVAGLLAGYGVAIPMGPVGTYLMVTAARAGWAAGAAAALGVATVDGVYAAVAVLGGAALGGTIAPALPVLRWVAVVVLAVVAVRILAAARPAAEGPGGAAPAGGGDVPAGRSPAGRSRRRTYLTFVGLTALNPTTVVYFVALVVGLRSRVGLSGPAAAGFVAAAFAASASWQLLLAGGGTLVGRSLSNDTARRATAVVSGLVIAALAAHLAIR